LARDQQQVEFIKYYDAVIPFLINILTTATDKTARMLRAKSMECISLVGMAVGKERFREDAKGVMQVLVGLQATQMEDDDPTISYMLQVSVFGGCMRRCERWTHREAEGRGLRMKSARVMLLCTHGNVPQMHQHQSKLGTSSGKRSGQRARKRPAGVPGSAWRFTGCRSRSRLHLLSALSFSYLSLGEKH